MPYIITTRAYATSSACPRLPAPRIRRAVATLEEARDATFNARVNDDSQIEPLPESGGTIGPLPDGTVIEVERIDWPRLATLTGIGGNHRELIDAYNAAQEQGG